MIELEILVAGAPPTMHPVTERLTIGRHPETCQIAVGSPQLSKQHLEVEPTPHGVRVRDLGSKNGSSVGGEPLTTARVLTAGDEVLLGGVVRVVVRGRADGLHPSDDATLAGPTSRALAVLGSSHPELARELDDRIRDLELQRDAIVWARHRLQALLRCRTDRARLELLVHEARSLTGAVCWALSWEGDASAGRVSFRHLVHSGEAPDLPDPGGIAKSIVGGTANRGIPVWTEDAQSDERFANARSVVALRLRSVGCVPLGPRAALYLSDAERSGAFSLRARARLEALCRLATAWLTSPGDGESGSQSTECLPGVVGRSAAMQQVADDVRTFARLPYTILILGPRGSGKSHVAKAIHELSGRTGQLVHASIIDQPKELVADALFGHQPGAFTGARGARKGWAESARDGTLLLDEIGDLPPDVQPSLLTMLQERTFQPVGSDRKLKLSARVIAATNLPIDKPDALAVPFRRDLYDRLAEVVIRIPPLSERPEDLTLLAAHLLAQERERFVQAGSPAPESLSDAALMTLRTSSFDGNVRGLRSTIVRAMALATREGSTTVERRHLTGFQTTPHEPVSSFEGELDEHRRRLMLDAYARAEGNQTRAAKLLGMNTQKWHRLRNRLGLTLG